mmetsp:Transcript_24585/g.40468  ORF Transcript_24585/g.40468 Transcript_24585/m.40468 type:complete len:154 (-) Transcript_24585:415-876(-)
MYLNVCFLFIVIGQHETSFLLCARWALRYAILIICIPPPPLLRLLGPPSRRLLSSTEALYVSTCLVFIGLMKHILCSTKLIHSLLTTTFSTLRTLDIYDRYHILILIHPGFLALLIICIYLHGTSCAPSSFTPSNNSVNSVLGPLCVVYFCNY